MASFFIAMEVGDPQGTRYEPVNALVDENLVNSGPIYNILPSSMLERLNVRPTEMGTFVIGFGNRIMLEVGETRVRLDGREYTVPVVFGDDHVQPLMGSVTLEVFRLAIDPANQRLVPVDAWLPSVNYSLEI